MKKSEGKKVEEVREYGKKSQPKIRYSQFDAEDIRKELLERYGMEMPVECRLFDYGMNDIYRIKTKKETYFLRISLAGLHIKRIMKKKCTSLIY